ncbi:M1 family metallopeptidase [Allomuricauda sp. NBRC 101325]|uniref:M1 family metallopeptidase n=1 Tax=Allomuricauda sp. NBRC 101325 TaxID=1113758 RepID=UPI0024A069F0|nr:M1 family metallopeptidase [Muricauda sp. NBRC 101325]GLU44655.1 aminopeptidase [Muricauda sp. NBRC 101325]
MKLTPILIFFFFSQLLSSQTQDKVDFVRGAVFIEPIPQEKQIKGSVSYQFDVKSDVESIFLDAVNMEFSKVALDDETIDFEYDNRKLTIKPQLLKDKNHTLRIDYVTKPKQTVYFIEGNPIEPPEILAGPFSPDDVIYEGDWTKIVQVWTQGQGKYTSHWLPSLDDMTDKIEFDISIIADMGFTVISNGKLKSMDSIDEFSKLWQFDMQNPMSSYLVGFAIGNFDKVTVQSSSGIPIELYYEPKDSLKVEPTYRYSKRIFDFLEQEIGVAYPWQNYKQVPVQDFLYAGMENTTCTIFSNQYVIDSTAFVDKNYVNVNAHELAHQWFGNLVTETSSEHHWLHEGFATFYAYLAERDIFGNDYYYWRLWETATALNRFSEDDQGEALQNPNAGSLTFYEKGAWALVMLQEKVGEEAFKKAIKTYLKTYAYQSVSIPDFITEMEKESGLDLKEFHQTWLRSDEFPMEEVKAFLSKKSASLNRFFELQDQIGEQKDTAETIVKSNWENFNSSFLKRNLVLKYGSQFSPSFLQEVLHTDDLKERQSVILSQNTIPKELQTEMESLLNDTSYTTIEAALYRLWTDFPEKRAQYLDATNGIDGFPNKNIRLLWLTLALVTPDYQPDRTPTYFQELTQYTGSAYHFETRLLAFQYLQNIGGFAPESLKNLIDACNHHVWHFKKSAMDMLNNFLKEEGNLAKVKSLYPSLSQEEKRFLDKTLGE